MKDCELCKAPARMYCESDEASLCWDCDAKIHKANFLVARHTRVLLCQGCQTQTPWKASGEKLGPTITICDKCNSSNSTEDSEEGGGEFDGEGDSDDDLDYDDDDDEEDELDDEDDGEEFVGGDEEDEDGDNQVVPLSSTPPPPAASSSSDDSSNRVVQPLKRSRIDACADEEEDLVSQVSESNDGVEAMPLRPSKTRKGMASDASSETEVILNSLKRFEKGMVSSRMVHEVCRLSRNPTAVVESSPKSLA